MTLLFQGKLSDELKAIRLKELNTADKMGNAAASLRAQLTNGIDGTIDVYQNVDHQ